MGVRIARAAASVYSCPVPSSRARARCIILWDVGWSTWPELAWGSDVHSMGGRRDRPAKLPVRVTPWRREGDSVGAGSGVPPEHPEVRWVRSAATAACQRRGKTREPIRHCGALTMAREPMRLSEGSNPMPTNWKTGRRSTANACFAKRRSGLPFCPCRRLEALPPIYSQNQAL